MERIFHAVRSFRARPLFSRARGPEGNYRLRNVYKSGTCGGGNFGRSRALCAQPHFNCPASVLFLFLFLRVVRVSRPELCELEDAVKYDYSIGVAKGLP